MLKPKHFEWQLTNIAKHQNWWSVIFHSDAQELVLAVNRKLAPAWDYIYVLDNFWMTVGYLSDWSCIWISASQNCLAHGLARIDPLQDGHDLCIFERVVPLLPFSFNNVLCIYVL